MLFDDTTGGATHAGQRLHRLQSAADTAQDEYDVSQGQSAALVDLQA